MINCSVSWQRLLALPAIMFESIGRAVLTHKKILITALAVAVIAGYVLPTPLNTAADPNSLTYQ